MNIEWTNCSERMPPQRMVVIIRNYEHKNYSSVLSGAESQNFGCDQNDEWTPFTQEKWEFLNK